MPADPREYQIVRNLQTTLLGISLAAGYHHDVAAAMVKLDPNQAAETLIAPNGLRPFLLIDVQPESWDYNESDLHFTLTLPVLIHWVSDSVPTTDESRVSTYFKACADIEKAIAVDITRGGLAIAHLIGKRSFDTALDGAQVWAIVETQIRLQRKYGSPNG